jgi:hypothetical protein
MELPELPATPRKASSTTLRSATGERRLPRRESGRWRAPAVVAGVALVSAVAALVALRGKGDDRRAEPEQTSFETAPATHPVSAAPGEEKTALPAQARDPGPHTAPIIKTVTASPEPAQEKTPAIEKTAAAASAKTADNTVAHKRGPRGSRRLGAGKGPRANPAASPAESTDSPSATPTKTANDAPVIQP